METNAAMKTWDIKQNFAGQICNIEWVNRKTNVKKQIAIKLKIANRFSASIIEFRN